MTTATPSAHEHETAAFSRGGGREQASRLAHLQEVLDHAVHYLPAQGPIKVFIHHNTLHAFEDLRFDDGVKAGSKLFGCQPYLAEDGYRQMLGRRFDEGIDLSGGEWQKIALARAYMRDAQVLILDEPTAALDARAEYEVFRRFSELMAGRTGVLISHRFSTVRMADRIVVLRGGEVVETGTHEQLVSAGGLYAELFGMQAVGYR